MSNYYIQFKIITKIQIKYYFYNDKKDLIHQKCENNMEKSYSNDCDLVNIGEFYF
jgi:hypothetical protein